jgi:hypothetical protein
MRSRQLFLFWQFNGDNRSYCQLKCPECYGRAQGKTYRHYWNGKIGDWEQAFTRLNRDIYFVFSYGEALLSHGFFECVDMIGRHPTWTLCIITNLMAPDSIVERLVDTKLAREGRLFITPCWHPEGVDDPVAAWETFKKHLHLLRDKHVPVHVMMVWFQPVIQRFPAYFKWLDANGFRVGVRRYVNNTVKPPLFMRALRCVNPKLFAGKFSLAGYSEAEKGYLYAYTCPKVTEYALNLKSSYGKTCLAGKDLVLVKHDGTVTLCADCYGKKHVLGNIFDESYRLNSAPAQCPTNSCGGDYGMLHLSDDRFGALPSLLWHDNFISQVEDIPDGVLPVPYPKRVEMLKWLSKL